MECATSRDTASAMSQENVEIVRRIFDAFFERRDREEYASLLHPDLEVIRSRHSTASPPGRGVVGLENWAGEWASTFGRYRMRPEEFLVSGDRVVVGGEITGTVPRTDVEVSEPFWEMFSFQDGLVTRIQAFASREEALEAAGLSE